MFKKIIPNKKVIAVYLGIVLGLMIAAHFFILGINKVKTAEISYNAIKSQVQAETVRASVLTSAKHELLNLQKQWEMVKQPYIFDPEGGNFYNQLGILADKYKIKDISIIPHPIQERFFMGHLRVLPYDLTIKGSFPNVFNLLSGLEKLDTPAEIKPISIRQQDDGTVLVKTTVFLYSLNPPEQKEYVNGQSGRYDPFFNPDVQKVLEQQQNSTNTQNNQSQNNSLNNTSQSNNNTSNNPRQNSSNKQSSSQQSNAAPVTSTQQTGNSQTIPPYNSTTTK